MKFGLFGGVNTGSRSVAQGNALPASRDKHPFRDLADAIVQAESAGFVSVFLVEHHFSGSGQLSSALNLLSFIAARTHRIRLGTAVIVLPWHNPVLLAEQVATLDVLSNGRFDLGVGRGYRPSEFAWFCMSAEEAAERYREGLALLKRSLTSAERFSHSGKFWQFQDIVVEPAPVQSPHPPVWVAAGRPESIAAAARDGHNLLLDQFATFDTALERCSVYRAEVERQGLEFDPSSVALARGVRIVRNAAQRAEALEQRARQLASMNQLAGGQSAQRRSSMMSDPDVLRAAEAGTLIGTPAEIIERIHRLRADGVEYLLLSGLMSDRQQLEWFAESILPAC